MNRYNWFFEAARNVSEVRDYSGRGMYGKRCLAIEVARGNVLELAADLMEEVHEDNIQALADVFRNARTDSLGLDEIVYFPEVEWQAEWDEDNSEDDEDSEAAE